LIVGKSIVGMSPAGMIHSWPMTMDVRSAADGNAGCFIRQVQAAANGAAHEIVDRSSPAFLEWANFDVE
jgi:hypothetical protein